MVPSCLLDGAVEGAPTSGTLLLSRSPSRACSLFICSRSSSSCFRSSCTFWLEESDWAATATGIKPAAKKARIKETTLRVRTSDLLRLNSSPCRFPDRHRPKQRGRKHDTFYDRRLDGRQNKDNCNFLQSADSNNEVRDSYGDSHPRCRGSLYGHSDWNLIRADCSAC